MDCDDNALHANPVPVVARPEKVARQCSVVKQAKTMRTTSLTSVTASSADSHSKPSAPKKAKLESSACSVHTSGVPDTKPGQIRSRSAYRNVDLPAAVQADQRWTKKFLPTIMLWAGNYDDIWSIPDDVLLHHVQLIFDAVYKELKIIAVRGGVMHSL
ncbi:hypothetical protein AZE42_13892, partial [Rhizopogon vesiculosus]